MDSGEGAPVKTFLLTLVPVAAVCIANAQNTRPQPAFEVASVKRSDQCFGRNSIDPGSVSLRGAPLKAVLMEAFQIKMDQIEGPSWLEAECFDISAKIPDGITGDQVPMMLQVLLAERFRLAAHKEVRLRSGHALVVDKDGPKFKEATANFVRGKGLMLYGPGVLKGAMTMATLASNLSTKGYGPVQDSTGLTGKYEIELRWTPNPDFQPTETFRSVAVPPGWPEADLFTAVRESLGLRLERRNVEVPFLLIDHVERTPTGN